MNLPNAAQAEARWESGRFVRMSYFCATPFANCLLLIAGRNIEG